MSERARSVHPGMTLGLLAVVCVSYVLQQTLVVPALPTIQRDLGTTTAWATWVFTGFLLTSAVATPLLGKLGDTYGKKRLLMVAMAIFAVGTVASALAGSIAMLIAARALQGAAGAIFPLAFGIVRDELPAHRVGMGLGLLSATFGVGGGAGLVLSGVILEHLHWSWLFWIGAAPIVVALVLVWRMLPESPIRTPSRVDWQGALALSVGLCALLVALSEGESWGWLSGATLGLFAAAALALCGWVAVELRVDEPMVDIGMMRDRAVLWTNIVAFIVGFAMFGVFLLVPTFVQMGAGLPPEVAALVPYGMAASVIVAGLYLLPSSAVMLVVGPTAGVLEGRVGARALTLAGSVVLGAGGLLLAVAHDSGAQIVAGNALVGMGVGLVYAMLAKLIVDAVPPSATGVAMGMNTVMRTIGGVVGGQVGAALLSAFTIPGTGGIPQERAFTMTFLVAGAAALLAAAATLRIPPRGSEAAAAGRVALTAEPGRG
ncbi:MFS transporter [Miltoncostaea marina]|uniref:MFS transporter n=1 Tax=Miltoncostaea marina TaxID=2843215 RepID=UPI001C3C5923|nr:MFS transporter [Miltoncostaea marina]